MFKILSTFTGTDFKLCKFVLYLIFHIHRHSSYVNSFEYIFQFFSVCNNFSLFNLYLFNAI